MMIVGKVLDRKKMLIYGNLNENLNDDNADKT